MSQASVQCSGEDKTLQSLLPAFARSSVGQRLALKGYVFVNVCTEL